MDDGKPCAECAALDARLSLATSLAVVAVSLAALLMLALFRGGVLSPADLLGVPRG